MTNFPGEFERQMRQLGFEMPAFIRVLPALVVISLAGILLFSSWFTIEPEESGVILRFGKYNRTVEPGLHFKLPIGLERVYKVPVKRQLKQEFGFRTVEAGVRSQFAAKGYEQESQMLTGDLNVADVEWVTQYRISDPRNYLFKVRHLGQTFHDMNEAVMREIVGDRTINEVITTGRKTIEDLVRVELQERCRQYEMGIVIDQVILQDVNPPESVKPAFNEVNQAQQEKEKLINQARQEYNQVIPKAKGDADRIIEEARGYAVERVNRAKGEADRFNSIFQEYTKAPEVTRQRIFLESMEAVLDQTGRKIVIDEGASGILPLLNLTPENQAK
ncbi:MAG: FtsH protease activity modulator HflK [Candidatus Omnitrophica bacterium]|nr:FtsH protease activity modulator HflK [Candidatus Omnitrophota bacterium]